MDDGKPENTSTKDWLIFMATARTDVLDIEHPRYVSTEEIHEARGGAERNKFAPDPSKLGKSRPDDARGAVKPSAEDPSFESCFRNLRKPEMAPSSVPSPRRGTPDSPNAPPAWKPYQNEPIADDQSRGEPSLTEMPPDPWDGTGAEVGGAFAREMIGEPKPGDGESRPVEQPWGIHDDMPYRPPDIPGGAYASPSRNPEKYERSGSPGLFEAEMTRQDTTQIGRGDSPRLNDVQPFGGRSPSQHRDSPKFGGRQAEEAIDDCEVAKGGSPRLGSQPFPDERSSRWGPSDNGLPPGVRRFEEDKSERYLKKELLAELDELIMKGFRPTETYTIDSDLADIRWEVNRLNDMRHRINKTRQWRHRISRSVRLAERLDQEYGPKLHISGVSEDVQEELGGWDKVLDEPLDRIFRKSRRGESNPYMDIAGALASTVALRFITNAFLKGRKSDLLYQTVLGDRKTDVSGPEPPPAPQQPPVQPSRPYVASPHSNAWGRAPNEFRAPVSSPRNGFAKTQEHPATTAASPRNSQFRQEANVPSPKHDIPAENRWATPNEATATAWAGTNDRASDSGRVRRRPRVPMA
jgi:hypothetical protein